MLALCEGLALFVAVCTAAVLPSRQSLLVGGDVAIHVGHALMLASCCVLTFYYNNLYDLRRLSNLSELSRRLLQSLLILLGLWTVTYITSSSVGPGVGPFLSHFSHVLLPLALVLLLRGTFYAVTKTRFLAKRVIILGTGVLAQEITKAVDASPHLHYTIMGYVHDDGDICAEAVRGPYPILGPLELLVEIIEQRRPDLIIVALNERRLRLPVWALLHLRINGIMVEDGIEVYERCTGKMAIECMMPSYLVFSKDFVKSQWLLATQQLLSCSVAALGLLVTTPLMLLIAVVVKLDSEGPAFFVQDRAGLRGRTFRLVKFRTMYLGYDAAESVWNRDVSSGLTPTGRWLRRFYLDELPQLFNILRGDMAFVGPRPEIASNVKTMTEQIPYYPMRLAVRPGLTGWAQIRYGYAMTQEEVTEKMRYDLYYLKHMSLRFDLQIMLDTVKNILIRRGT